MISGMSNTCTRDWRDTKTNVKWIIIVTQLLEIHASPNLDKSFHMYLKKIKFLRRSYTWILIWAQKRQHFTRKALYDKGLTITLTFDIEIWK
jgi:hypothetical protein